MILVYQASRKVLPGSGFVTAIPVGVLARQIDDACLGLADHLGTLSAGPVSGERRSLL
jgi:hypothetical protein